MKLRRIVSLLLTLLMVCTMAVVSANAADTDKTSTGAYYNQAEASGRGYLDSAYSGTDLGSTYTPSATTWKVWSPAASKIQLKLYKTGTDRENGAGVIGVYDLAKGTSSVWSLTLSGDYKNVYYTYLVTAKNVNGTVETTETQDVYSKAVGANGDRSMVVDLDSTDPEGWSDDKHVTFKTKTEAAVWELHVRDFSADPDSGVSTKNQGNYLAFTEGGTTYKKQGSLKTCMDYLVENNINTVQILPIADFDGVDEIYGASANDRNWGYNPKNFNVPDGSYSSNAYDGNVRITEVKQMIQALHDRGISVVMDVVYNHTAGADGSCFTKTVPGYYYRMTSNVAYADGSGQGNELASDKKMGRNFIIQSLAYWAEEYHIDGFRFDLMGCIDITTLNQARARLNQIDKNILMYGEPWSGGSSSNPEAPNESNTTRLSSGVGVFSGTFRTAATRVNTTKAAAQGWVGGTDSGYDGAGTNVVVNGIKGNIHDPNDNTKTVNLIDCHDDLTVWDKIVGAYTTSGEGKNSKTSAANVNSTASNYLGSLKIAGALTLTSQGISFANAGTEFARTKNGQANSYNSPDSINMLDWKRAQTYSETVAYFKGLRQINEVYSPFNDDGTTSKNTMSFKNSTGTFIAYTINNNTANRASEWGTVAVLMNSGSSAATANLGSSGWEIVANEKQAGVKSLGTVSSSSYTVPAKSVAILVQSSSYKDFSDKFKYGTLTTNHHVNGQVTTVKSTYRIGTKYRALKDADLLKSYNVTKTEGTPSGTFTADTTVDYYYESNGKTTGTLTVKYINQSGATLTPDMTYTMEAGEKYSIPVCAIQSYQLDTDKYPSGTVGTFDGNSKTITFTYKPLASQKITVHYRKTNSWTTVRCYAYTDNGDEPLGAWSSAARMTLDSSLGSNWYTVTIPVASCRVMFHNGQGGQEPGANEPGYSVAGECFIDNKIVTYDSTVITSYINVATGQKLKADLTETGTKKNTDQYTTKGDDTLGTLVEPPANASGFCQPGVTNVVYLYSTGTPVETTTAPIPTTTSPIPSTSTEATTTIPPVTGESYILGDTNCDKSVNILDVTYVQQFIVNLTFFDSNSYRNGDVDGNGIVNIKDASYIQRWVAKITVPYPIGQEVTETSPAQTTPTTQAQTTTPPPPATTEPQYTEPQYTEPPFPDYPDPTPDYATVLFTNNKGWQGTIYCYYWFDGDAPEWPGEPMSEVGMNDYGEPQYSIEIPLGVNVIFTNGESQTADAVFSGQTGFYPTDDMNDQGHYIAGSW